MVADKKNICLHDYKNAVQVGSVDYCCQLCGKLIDPCEWFLMNSFEFVDVDLSTNKSKRLKKHNKLS